MNKLLFEIHLSWRYIVHYWQISLIMIFSFAFALILPFMALAHANVYFDNSDTFSIKQPDNTIIAHIAISDKSEPLRDVLKDYSYAVARKEVKSCFFNDESLEIPVYYATKNILEYESFDLTNGSWNQTEEATCYVSDGFFAFYGNVAPGDTLELDGVSYKVGGIFKSLRYHTDVFILLDEDTYDAGIGEYELYVRSDENGMDLKTRLMDASISVSTIDNALSIVASAVKSETADIAKILLIAFVCFLFATINIISVTKGKFDLFLTQTGIELSVGASLRDVYITSLISNLLLLITSLPLITLMAYIIRSVIPASIETRFGSDVLIETFCLGLLMCLAVTTALVNRIRKLDIAAIVRGAA